MSCPTEGIESAAFGNNIDLIRETLESKHGKCYRIYNLANKTYRKEKFSQVIDLGMQLSNVRAPPISLMIKLSANVNKFLNCNDGRAISAIAVCTLLMYFDIIKTVDACLTFFHTKRGNVNLTTVQYKYLKDTQQLFASFRHELDRPFKLLANEFLLSSILLVGIPLFNRQRWLDLWFVKF